VKNLWALASKDESKEFKIHCRFYKNTTESHRFNTGKNYEKITPVLPPVLANNDVDCPL